MTEAVSTTDQAKDLRRENTIAAYSKPFYRYLVLGILTTVYISNFVDRQVINVLAAYIIERHLGQSWARKSLRILVMDSPRPANAPQPQPTSDYQVENKWVVKALLLMEQNLSRPLATDEIALRINISKRQLERLFLADTGESLQKFYRKIRLSYALWLLQNTQRSITDIAQECGFADTAHFSRAFRSAFATRPTEYRNQ